MRKKKKKKQFFFLLVHGKFRVWEACYNTVSRKSWIYNRTETFTELTFYTSPLHSRSPI